MSQPTVMPASIAGTYHVHAAIASAAMAAPTTST
jgi:hypothetical protein